VCPVFPGVKVQWEATAYTYSENIGTVQLILHKVGFTVSNVSVEVMTVVGNATGMTNQAYETSPDNILCLQCALIDHVLPTATIHNMYFIFFQLLKTIRLITQLISPSVQHRHLLQYLLLLWMMMCWRVWSSSQWRWWPLEGRRGWMLEVQLASSYLMMTVRRHFLSTP